LAIAVPALAITPDNPGAAAIQFTANAGQNIKSISPYIYGSNSSVITSRTLDRAGGNRWTGYNWENNASNAGADWYHHSDYLLTNGLANQVAQQKQMLRAGVAIPNTPVVSNPSTNALSPQGGVSANPAAVPSSVRP